MILYNITFNIDLDAEESWVQYMKESHIPTVMASDSIIEYKFLHLLNETESEGETYALQLFCESIEKLEDYVQKDASESTNKLELKFSGKQVSFATVLEDV